MTGETTVVWDRQTGTPIHNAIVWQDRRTARFCDELKRTGHGEVIARKSGLVIDAYFSGSKLRWLLDNVAGARQQAARGELAFGTIDTWLLWNLTGGAHLNPAVTLAMAAAGKFAWAKVPDQGRLVWPMR